MEKARDMERIMEQTSNEADGNNAIWLGIVWNICCVDSQVIDCRIA
jgi:hypothetical protein